MLRSFPTNAEKRRYWKNRQYVLARDPLCQICQNAPSAEADHILALSLGGADTIDNMQGLCVSCHKRKSREDKRKAYRARQRAKIRKVGMDGFPVK